MTTAERWFIHISTLLTGLSGIAYGVMKYLMTTDDPFAVANHPMQPWALSLHVLASPAMLFAIGLITAEHVLPQFRRPRGGRGRGTGVFTFACLAPMVATGYLIQVATSESLRTVCILVHIATGLTYVAAYLAHLMATRGRAAAARAAMGGSPLGIGIALSVWRRTAAPRPRAGRVPGRES